MICFDTVALGIRIDTMILPGRLAVNSHPEADLPSVGSRAKHHVQVPAWK
jgi:hypothetical protein